MKEIDDVYDNILNKSKAKKYKRFDRMVLITKKDLLVALAANLVKLSPYTVPDNLSSIIIEFEEKVPYTFDSIGIARVSLMTMTNAIYNVLEKIPKVMQFNEPKNIKALHTNRLSECYNPDADFIDIMALAKNVTCYFADEEDAKEYLTIINNQ